MILLDESSEGMHSVLPSAKGCFDSLQDQPQNELVIRIQPDEAIYYRSIVLGRE